MRSWRGESGGEGTEAMSRREISGRCLRITHAGLLDLLIADKKDIASDNENSILLLMKQIWL